MALPQALIFDLDGTLAETQPVWRAAEQAFFEAIGHTWTPEVQKHYMGMNALDLAATVHALLRPAMDRAACQRCMREALVRAYEEKPLTPIPGSGALVKRLHGHVPMAVASGSPPSGIQAALTQLGLTACFDHVLSSEAVAQGKPAPDVFLAAAQALGAAPAACLVFEDSVVGAEAARAAGMACIVRPGLHADAVHELATRVVSSWDEVKVADVFSA